MLQLHIDSFLLDAWKPRSTLIKVVFSGTSANAAKIGNNVTTHFSSDYLGFSRGDTV
jgi:hypothetical protein